MEVSFLPYEEPPILTILSLCSFLLFLNTVNTLFNKYLSCGLIGQLLIGLAYGTPGLKLLSQDTEIVIVHLGYLGLILLVYEGGLSTNFSALKANLWLSIAVALTGISFPMALSFALVSLVGATPLQSFAAGAALCSTSLGTTFTVLASSGLSATRLGVVLSAAAMMDDVIGLVMVQVISNLGGSSGGFEAVTVVRPLGVSVGLAVAVPVICGFLVKPVTKLVNGMRRSQPDGVVSKGCEAVYAPFLIHTAILVGMVTGASYAGTSNLFAAYLAGAAISWWDSDVPHLEAAAEAPGSQNLQSEPATGESSTQRHGSISSRAADETKMAELSSPTRQNSTSETTRKFSSHATMGVAVYEAYFAPATYRILQPFFFASIGFAIPITDMFSGPIIWRGFVYTLLMLFGKLVTGVWLIRLDIPRPRIKGSKSLRWMTTLPALCFRNRNGAENPASETRMLRTKGIGKGKGKDNDREGTPQRTGDTLTTSAVQAPKIKKPLSIYPASIIGTAMTARGEIGFLIASIAETTGLFASSSEPNSTGSSGIYLVVTWAIVLCTIVGPLGMGALVRRVRRLQKEGGGEGPLGVWGVG